MAGHLSARSNAIVEDVRDGKVTVKAARDLYGVALDEVTFKVDESATARLREALRAKVDVGMPPLYTQ